MARRPTTIQKSGTIHLPVSANDEPKVKIQIVNDSATYTVLDTTTGASASNNWLLNAQVIRPVTTGLSTCKVTISNREGQFLNTFNGGEIIKVYGDYTDATNLLFYGTVDDVKYGVNMSDGFYVSVDGRAYPEMTDRTITSQHVAARADSVIGNILYENYSDVTLLFWNGTVWAEGTYNPASGNVSWDADVSSFPSTLINVKYQHKKGWTAIKETLERATLDGYLEYDESGQRWTLRTFVENSIDNSAENIGYGVNLINAAEYGIDNTNIANKIIVYGKKESDNIVLIKTEENLASQADLWIKEKIVQDNSIDNMSEVQDKADYELSQGIAGKSTGRMTAIGMPTLKPGEKIAVSIPYTGINGLHKVQKLTHNINNTFTTNVELSKELKQTQNLFQSVVNPDDFVQGTVNLNSMKDSYTVYFSEDPSVMNHSNTSEADGRLTLSNGQVNGVATSNIITADYDVSYCEFRRFENYDTYNDTYEVTNDGGDTWEMYSTSSGETHTFSTTGKVIKDRLGFRINMTRNSTTATSPQYDAVCMLYK